MIKNLMSLSILALMTALTMVISGCGEDSSGNKVKFKLGVIKKLDTAALMGGANAQNILVTEDKKLAYVLDNKGGLWRVALGDKENAHNNIHDKAKWHFLTVMNTGLDDTVSQAKLDKGENNPAANRRIHLAKEGLVITGSVSATTNYIAFIKHGDDKPSLAWINDGTTHSDAAAFPDTTTLRAGKTIIAEHDGKSLVILDLTNGWVASFELKKGTKISGIHKNDVAATFTNLAMAVDKDSNATKVGKLYFVHALGVNHIPLDKLGSAEDAKAVDAEAVSAKWRMNTTFTTTNGLNYGGGNATGAFSLKSNRVESGVVGSTGIDNDLVSSVTLYNGKLYISLRNAGHLLGADVFTGGVAVYDIAANKTTAPDQAYFGGKAGPEFKLYHDKLVIVNDDAILPVDDKGHVNGNIISNAMIQNNVYSKKEIKLGLDVGTTLFMLKNRQATLWFNDFISLGDDIIIYKNDAPGGTTWMNNAYSVHYEDNKEVPVKNTSEKPGESQE